MMPLMGQETQSVTYLLGTLGHYLVKYILDLCLLESHKTWLLILYPWNRQEQNMDMTM